MLLQEFLAQSFSEGVGVGKGFEQLIGLLDQFSGGNGEEALQFNIWVDIIRVDFLSDSTQNVAIDIAGAHMCEGLEALTFLREFHHP